jgi:predicted acyltransferase
MAIAAQPRKVSATATPATEAGSSGTSVGQIVVKPGRIVSLDVFRGMTIAAMILVNNAGGPMYGPLDHAEWNGWTHTDLIFPFFMFIAGASMALSFGARWKGNAFTAKDSDDTKGKQTSQLAAAVSQDSRRRMVLHVVRRGAIIFFIGLWLNLFPWFFDANRYANLRIPGVLQRIGFCYIIAGIIYLYATKRARAAVVVAALLAYWAAMKLVPVPGVGAGDLSPNNNLAAYIDNMIFTARHMWQHRPWDPEGLLSSVPAVCTMLIGTFVGELLAPSGQWLVASGQQGQKQPQGPSAKSGNQDDAGMGNAAAAVGANDNDKRGADADDEDANAGEHPLVTQLRLGLRDHEHDRFAGSGMLGPGAQLSASADIQSTWQYKVGRLVSVGALFIIVGEVWNLWFPINKSLWTSSYVMFTAGYAMIALAAIYWVVDVRGWRRWATPFLVFGTNAILAFTLSTWVTKLLLVIRVPSGRVVNGQAQSSSAWSWIIVHSWRLHFANPLNSSLVFALSYVLIWMAVMWWFYRKGIFVKI